MGLIDTHVHVWDPDLGSYPWLDGEPELGRRFLPADLDRGAATVTGMIFVEAGAADPLAEATWVQSLASGWPELIGIVASAGLEQGSSIRDHLDALRELPLVVGIRRLLQDEPPDFFDLPGLVEGLRETAAMNLTFDACIRHHQLPALTALLSRVPELTVVLDHLGKPPVATGELAEWLGNLRALAANPRVSVKLSGLAPEADAALPVRGQVEPYLAAALDTFGPDRSMLGSDWPVSTSTGHRMRYDEWFAVVLDGVGVAGSDREAVTTGTAERVYGVEATNKPN